MITTTAHTNKIEFPKLMMSDAGTVVLMSKDDNDYSGVVVATIGDHCPYYVGYYSAEWNINKFADYNQVLTLKNLSLQM